MIFTSPLHVNSIWLCILHYVLHKCCKYGNNVHVSSKDKTCLKWKFHFVFPRGKYREIPQNQTHVLCWKDYNQKDLTCLFVLCTCMLCAYQSHCFWVISICIILKEEIYFLSHLKLVSANDVAVFQSLGDPISDRRALVKLKHQHFLKLSILFFEICCKNYKILYFIKKVLFQKLKHCNNNAITD